MSDLSDTTTVFEGLGFEKIQYPTIDGWFWSPDCEYFQRKAGRYYYTNGEVADHHIYPRMGPSYRETPPEFCEDMSLWTDEKRAVVKAHLKAEREAAEKARIESYERAEKLALAAAPRLTFEEFQAIIRCEDSLWDFYRKEGDAA